MTDAGSLLSMIPDRILVKTRRHRITVFLLMLPHFLEVQRVNYVVSVSVCFGLFFLHSVVSLASAAQEHPLGGSQLSRLL